jgi:hypothetical protein
MVVSEENVLRHDENVVKVGAWVDGLGRQLASTSPVRENRSDRKTPSDQSSIQRDDVRKKKAPPPGQPTDQAIYCHTICHPIPLLGEFLGRQDPPPDHILFPIVNSE